MDSRIPRKKKFKSLEKNSLKTYLPKSPYHYAIFKSNFFINNKKREKDYQELLPLPRKLSGIIERGRLTYHGHNCLVTSNKNYSINFF
jgi:hypothetical protein